MALSGGHPMSAADWPKPAVKQRELGGKAEFIEGNASHQQIGESLNAYATIGIDTWVHQACNSRSAVLDTDVGNRQSFYGNWGTFTAFPRTCRNLGHADVMT